MIEGALFLNLSADLRLDHITATVNALVVHVVSTQVVSCCPLCDQASDQIHSRAAKAIKASRRFFSVGAEVPTERK